MSADARHADEPDLAAIMAASAADRTKLLDLIRKEEVSAKARPAKAWLVVRQYAVKPDERVCQHRWEWVAELCAYRHERRADELGAFYRTRRAER